MTARVEVHGGLLEVVQFSVPCTAAAEWEDLGAMTRMPLISSPSH